MTIDDPRRTADPAAGPQDIVVGVQTVELSRQAICWAVAEAEARNVGVRLVHAIAQPMLFEPHGLTGLTSWPDLPLTELRDLAEDQLHLAQTYARSLSANVALTTAVDEGDAVSVLKKAGREARLIVIGSRYLGPLKSAFFGSTGVGLTHASETPFVVVRGNQPAAAQAPIVVGIDPTAGCERLVAAAAEQASVHGRPLRAVMCWEPFYYSPPERLHTQAQEIRAQAEIWLAEAVAGWQETYPEITIERELSFDYPASALIRESLSAALVVVGVGRNQLSRVLGSVARGVLHHAGCPVEVVPR